MKQLSAQQLNAIPQELKEAVCNSLVEMTIARVSGGGEEGRILYGSSPRRSIVSGQLLPRFNANNEDDTSDIRIAAIGADFQVGADSNAGCTVTPAFAVYVRVLPSWDELTDEALDLEPDFKLKKAIQDTIDARIRQLRTERYNAAKVAKPDWPSLNQAQRQEIRARRSAIEEEVRKLAYGEHGIKLESGDDQLLDTTPADLDQPPNPDSPDDTTSRLRFGRFLQRGRTVPPTLLESAHPPAKWLRLDLALPSFTFALDGHDTSARLNVYNGEMRAAALAQVRAWTKSDAGVRETWRNLRIRPEDIATRAAWDAWRQGASAVPVSEPDITPSLSGITLEVERTIDFLVPSRASIRVVLDNANQELSRWDLAHRLDTIFATALRIELPTGVHIPMQLDRVEPSYRFRHFLDYPAIGLNCGVVATATGGMTSLETTWSPRFVQPRIRARELDVPVTFKKLSEEQLPVSDLLTIPQEYLKWINDRERELTGSVREGLAGEDAERESKRLDTDLRAQRAEAEYIRRGIHLLMESQAAFQKSASESSQPKRDSLMRRAAPYRAWLSMNRSYLKRDKGSPSAGWRLFQLAFVLAHVPCFASRTDEYRSYYDERLDEMTASLLYFPTGGGKSEAFYGTLVFALFLDRLRGKSRGVSALIRYPLRLLTLQQGQRLLKLVAHAELQRLEEKVPGWPFEIGFWVGGNNTPNRYKEVPTLVPILGNSMHPTDELLEEGVPGRSNEEERTAEQYRDYRAAYDKVPECPCCGQPTGLRRVTSDGPTALRLAIACFDANCPFNRAHGHIEPLPFLLTDDTIYDRAPSIVLGTIDKLAMLGQSTSTIRRFLGMFGLARGVGPTGHLTAPRSEGDLDANLRSQGYEPVNPIFQKGQRVFFDPFPSLIVQDEAHLLEESLGTFSGLFDGLLEHAFRQISAMAGDELCVARVWTGDSYSRPRMPKVIAATATISNPERQLEVLYQREPLRFPYPGPDLYRSFFAAPAPAPAENPERVRLEQELPPYASPEATAPWMRLFSSVMTNDATHTVTSVAVLAAFHTVVSRLWSELSDPDLRDGALARLKAFQGSDRGAPWRVAALENARLADRWDWIAALVDLHRIALTYVTNKKGGDQVMDALEPAVHQQHRAAHKPLDRFNSRLISGGIDMRTIQEIMAEAQSAKVGEPYPPLDVQLRNIVATSAISHGVDVDRFNSMFFAGLPSDIAEYIQASSRVGRTHVGFVILVPTPQSRRDRYVVETHDIFHRFLERMISPPAVERWAENAVRRVMASLVQAWAMLEESKLLIATPDADKQRIDHYETIVPIRRLITNDPVAFLDNLGGFMHESLGMSGRGPKELGRPVYHDLYRRLVAAEVNKFSDSIRRMSTTLRLREYWDDSYAAFKPPMTSLRDVDEAGLIVAGAFDDKATAGRTQIRPDELIKVMKAIRQQRGGVAETDHDLDAKERGGSST